MIKKQSIKFGRSLRDLYKYQTLSVANTPFLTLSETNYFLKSRLESGTPFTAFKIGKNERDWLRLLLFPNSLKATLTRQKIRSWDSRLRGKNPAGLFPFNYAEVLNFSQLYYNCIKSADLICKFHSQKDNFLAEHIGNKAVVYSDSLNVFNLFLLLQSGIKKSDLWFNSLYGRILIVNPFENSIQNSIDVHSDFYSSFKPFISNLRFVKPPVNYENLDQNNFQNSWYLELDKLKQKISSIDFDVALIGAGCYSVPLCTFIKKELNKTSIHLGGTLHFNYGISGGRWKSTQPHVQAAQSNFLSLPPCSVLPVDAPDPNLQSKINVSDAYW